MSSVGTFLQLTAGPWIMLEMTGSPLMVGLVTTTLLLPRLLFTLPAGALADVVDRRVLIVGGHLGSALPAMALAVLVYVEQLTPSRLLALTFVLGLGAAFTHPAFQTLVPELVPREMLAQAITLNAAAFNVARSVGPSLGGLLVALGLTHLSFAANAVSYFAVVAVVLTFPKVAAARPARRRIWRSTLVGMRYVRHSGGIRRLMVVAGIFALTSACIEAVMPSWVAQDLGLDADGFGMLFGVFGFGALVGAATRERARIVIGDRMLPMTMTAFGLAGVAAGASSSAWIAGPFLFFVGTTWVWTFTTLNASVQTLAPRWVRGRVVGVFLLVIGLQPVGAFLAGVLAELFGGGNALIMMCAAALVLGLVAFHVDLPVLGRLREPEPVDSDRNPLSALHTPGVGGSPIVIMTTFEIAPESSDQFLSAMRLLRTERLRTGATKWALFRDAGSPHVMTEMFWVPDWDEHLAQHGRIDEDAAEVIRAARAFDVRGEPTSLHLAGLDVSSGRVAFIDAEAIDKHAQIHDRDGSVPLA